MGEPPTPRRFESSLFAFATDLADEGIDAVLDNVQHRAGAGGIMPAFVYHAARDIFPHNPCRKVALLDRGAFFFQPQISLYDGLRIQPRLDPLVRERDVLAETCRAAAARGLAVRAWTVFLHPDRPGEFPDCAPRNAFGDPCEGDLCPANPDVRAYVRALVADVARYEVETVVAESLHYHGLEHGHHHERYFIELGPRGRYLLGLCFCDHCLAAASRAGVDGSTVQAAVRQELEQVFAAPPEVAGSELERVDLGSIADGELSAYLDARAETVASLVAEASEVADARGRGFAFIELSGAVKGYATGMPMGAPAAESAWRLGVSLDRLRTACREVEVLAYTADVDRLLLDLEAYTRRLDGCAVSVALRPSPPDCSGPANLTAKVRAAREAGASRVDFYHYGFLRLEALDWIREALS